VRIVEIANSAIPRLTSAMKLATMAILAAIRELTNQFIFMSSAGGDGWGGHCRLRVGAKLRHFG